MVSSTRSWKQRLGRDKFIDIQPGPAYVPPLPAVARKLGRLLVALSVAAILFCGYFPFDFNFRDGAAAIDRRFDLTLVQQATAGDTFENILFFLPFGFALGAVLRRKWLKYWLGTAGAAMVIGAAVSSIVEIGQAFLAGRDPSLTDIVNNSIGTLIGFGIYRLIGDRALTVAAGAIEVVERKMGALMLAVLGMLWSAIACAAPIVLGADASNLGGWNPSYALAIGDEFGNQRRSWDGTVSELHIATTAADREQLAALFSGADPAALFGDSLAASYDLHGGPPFVDLTGKNPPLEAGTNDHLPRPRQVSSTNTTLPSSATTNAANATTVKSAKTMTMNDGAAKRASGVSDGSIGGQAFVSSYDHWLRSTGPVASLSRAVAEARQFTAIVTCASARPDQHQGARVFTISSDTAHRNLTLAQDGTKLLVRIRNQVNGENGAAPEFAMDDVFADQRPHRIIVTYANATVNVFIDGMRWKSTARITSEAATIWSLFPRPNWRFSLGEDDVAVNAYVYRAMVFLPLGALAAAMVNQMRRHHRERVAIAGALVVTTILAMEALLTTMGGQPLNLPAAILSLLCATIGILVVKIRHSDRSGAWTTSWI